MRTRQLTEAATHFTATAEHARQIGDAHWEGLGRMNLAESQLEAGDGPRALETVAPLPQFFADLHDPAYQGNALWLLSWAERLAGNLAAAKTAIDTALRIAEDTSNRMWEAFWLIEAARVHLSLGATDEAMNCCRMAASLERQIGDSRREAIALDCTGEVLIAAGNAEDAAAFHREAARMHEHLGDTWQQALATIHLADAEQARDQTDDSREQLRTALVLLLRFTDNKAMHLRAELQERLSVNREA